MAFPFFLLLSSIHPSIHPSSIHPSIIHPSIPHPSSNGTREHASHWVLGMCHWTRQTRQPLASPSISPDTCISRQQWWGGGWGQVHCPQQRILTQKVGMESSVVPRQYSPFAMTPLQAKQNMHASLKILCRFLWEYECLFMWVYVSSFPFKK